MINEKNVLDRCVDIEVERNFVGCLLIGTPFSTCMAIATNIVEDHRWLTEESVSLIYKTLKSEYKNGTAFDQDLTLLSGLLRDRGILEKVGGSVALADIANSVSSVAGLERYAKRVRELHFRRGILALFERGLRQLSVPLENGFIDEAKLWSAKIENTLCRRGSTNAIHISSVLPKIESAERKLCKSGISWIDNSIGLSRGEYVIVAGRPSMGKSSLANQLSTECAKRGHGVVVFSQEMSPLQWTINTQAREAGIDGVAIRQRKLEKRDTEKAGNASAKLRDIPLYFHDKSVQSIQAVVAETTQLKHSKGVELVIVDYIQNVPSGQGRKEASENSELTYISRELQRMARDLDVCVIAVSQLNRGDGSEQGKKTPPPNLARLRGSGAIEQDADVVLVIHRPEYYCQGKDCPPDLVGRAQVLCEKNRNGPTSFCWFNWIPKYYEFSELDVSDWPGCKTEKYTSEAYLEQWT